MPQRSRPKDETTAPSHPDVAHSEPQPSEVPTTQTDRERLAEEILATLEERGVPSGAWLVDIARTRHALQSADTLLRRLEDAIIRSASSSPLDPR
jgi:hypothetical protein